MHFKPFSMPWPLLPASLKSHVGKKGREAIWPLADVGAAVIEVPAVVVVVVTPAFFPF
jgi:hypothetical protein